MLKITDLALASIVVRDIIVTYMLIGQKDLDSDLKQDNTRTVAVFSW